MRSWAGKRAGYFKGGFWVPIRCPAQVLPKPRKRADKMEELQVKDVPTNVSITSHCLQDVESIQTAIEVIVRETGTQRSLAQLYPVLEASALTPSLVRPIATIHATMIDAHHTGPSGGHAAPDTVPGYPRGPSDKGSLRKGKRQGDPTCSARDIGTPDPR